MAYALMACNAIMGLIVFLRYGTMPPQIPLFYSHAQGEDQLAEWWMIFILPILMDLFVILNGFVSAKLFPGNEYVKKVLRYLNIGIMATLTVVFVKIILLVT